MNQEVLSGLALLVLSLSCNFYNEMINLTIFFYIISVYTMRLNRRPLIVLMLCASFVLDFMQI
jgi:hypothetical protein